MRWFSDHLLTFCQKFFFRKYDSFRDISVQLALGPGRFKLEMGLGGEKKHFLFYTPYVKNASFLRYSIVLFPYITVTWAHSLSWSESSLCELASLRSASLAIIEIRVFIAVNCKFNSSGYGWFQKQTKMTLGHPAHMVGYPCGLHAPHTSGWWMLVVGSTQEKKWRCGETKKIFPQAAVSVQKTPIYFKIAITW